MAFPGRCSGVAKEDGMRLRQRGIRRGMCGAQSRIRKRGVVGQSSVWVCSLAGGCSGMRGRRGERASWWRADRGCWGESDEEQAASRHVEPCSEHQRRVSIPREEGTGAAMAESPASGPPRAARCWGGGRTAGRRVSGRSMLLAALIAACLVCPARAQYSFVVVFPEIEPLDEGFKDQPAVFCGFNMYPGVFTGPVTSAPPPAPARCPP